MRTIEWDLLEAFQMNDLGGVRYALDKGANPGIVSENLPILLRAIFLGKEEIAIELVRAGASIETVDMVHGRAALAWAAYYERNIIMDFLIQEGAKLERKDAIGHTALMHATQKGAEETVKQLLNAGADVRPARDSEQAKQPFSLLPGGAVGRRLKEQLYHAYHDQMVERSGHLKKKITGFQKKIPHKRRPKM